MITGAGLGLRSEHFADILALTNANKLQVPWFEILADNHFGVNNILYNNLIKITNNYPVTLHCVGMSLGSYTGVDIDYLSKLKDLVLALKPEYISDHLSWSNTKKFHSHDLLPLPYNNEAIQIASDNIKLAQDYLGCNILLENVSSYLSYKDSIVPEWEFINKISHNSNCDILLDINNIYVSAYNNNFSAWDYLNNINKNKVKYCHLAGYLDCQKYLLDTHGDFISDKVWSLYKKSLDIIGPVPCCLEWDNDIPDFKTILSERDKIQALLSQKHIKEAI